MKTSPSEPKSRYDIIAHREIPPDAIVPNPLNPRPRFHLENDDPELVGLAESMVKDGQKQSIMVYELVGHYQYPDQPGNYILLQGERRWTAAGIGEMPVLKANVVTTPTTLSEELELLSSEDAHKLPWQPFFEMRHAHSLAQAYGLPTVRHPDIASKTGLSMDQLKIAEKIFSLTAPVQAMVEEYEEEMHRQRLEGRRKRSGRLAGAGARSNEFSPYKAALVYDIFTALRQYLTITVGEFNDEALQLKIANWATAGRMTVDDLRAFDQMLRVCGDNPPPGTLAKVAAMLRDDGKPKNVRGIARSLGNAHLQRLSNTTKKAERCAKESVTLVKKVDQFGNDVELLKEIRLSLMSALVDIQRLERAVSDRIHTIERRG